MLLVKTPAARKTFATEGLRSPYSALSLVSEAGTMLFARCNNPFSKEPK
jgi:hypothetical protein